jgi:hypothetical protein
MLILPGDPLFAQTLLTPRPDWQQVAIKDGDTYAFVVRPGSCLCEPVTSEDLTDYLEGGEYDDRLLEIDGEFDEDGDLIDEEGWVINGLATTSEF